MANSGGINYSLVKWHGFFCLKNLFLFIKQSTYLPCLDNRIPYSTKSPSGGESHPATGPSKGNATLFYTLLVNVSAFHSSGRGRYLTSQFFFSSQNNLARSSSTFLARIWVQEEPRQPWSSFSLWAYSSWSPLWFCPSDSTLQGHRWLTGKSNPVHFPRRLCEPSGFS